MKTLMALSLSLLLLAGSTALAQDDDFDRLPPERAEKVLRWLKENRPDWAEEIHAWMERGEEKRVHEALFKFEREMREGAEKEKGPELERFERALRLLSERDPKRAEVFKRLLEERRLDAIEREFRDVFEVLEREGAERGKGPDKERFERALRFLAERDPKRAENLGRFIKEGRFDVIEREFRDVFEAMEREHAEHGPPEADEETREMVGAQEKLDRQAAELAEAFRRSEGEERGAAKERLRETLAKLFEVREWFRRRELERLQKEIDEMRSVLEERQKNRDKIIEKRLREMLGEGDRLDW